MKLLAIIPARGGSKGIPEKNMQLLNGKTLVRHAIDVAVDSAAFERILVSSDNDDILELAQKCYGIKSLKRPAHLAQDDTPIASVIAHLLQTLYEQEHYQPDALMLLEPTCPLRTALDITQSIDVFRRANQPCLISVSPAQQHPSNMIYQDNGRWRYCLKRQASVTRRQDFTEALFINGAIYLTQYTYFVKNKRLYDFNRCAMYLMPADRSFDINTPFDLDLVRAHVNFQQERKN